MLDVEPANPCVLSILLKTIEYLISRIEAFVVLFIACDLLYDKFASPLQACLPQADFSRPQHIVMAQFCASFVLQPVCESTEITS